MKMTVLEMEATVSLNLKRKSKPNLQKNLNNKMRNQYKVSNQRRINGRLSLKCSAKPCKQQEGLMMYEEVVERKQELRLKQLMKQLMIELSVSFVEGSLTILLLRGIFQSVNRKAKLLKLKENNLKANLNLRERLRLVSKRDDLNKCCLIFIVS